MYVQYVCVAEGNDVCNADAGSHDVDEIRQLATRKIALVLAHVDPQQLSEAIIGIYQGCVGGSCIIRPYQHIVLPAARPQMLYWRVQLLRCCDSSSQKLWPLDFLSEKLVRDPLLTYSTRH